MHEKTLDLLRVTMEMWCLLYLKGPLTAWYDRSL